MDSLIGGVFMGLAAVQFWRKDFGMHSIIEETVAISVLFAMALNPSVNAAFALSCTMLVNPVVTSTTRCDASKLETFVQLYIPKQMLCILKNWRMFVAVSIFWTCALLKFLTEFWQSACVALVAGSLQLLRRPAWLKLKLREWRVATGPLYALAANTAFNHRLCNASGIVSTILGIGGILVVSIAAMALRPDNNEFDMALISLLPIQLGHWPRSQPARAKYHGMLMFSSLMIMAVLSIMDNAICQFCFCAALLAMETERRLLQRAYQSPK